ncbi:MAG: phosphoglucomutase, partial [Treponemataceae bacterium]|nr:phosphoglucomutase [Treponemataceae bacterium]
MILSASGWRRVFAATGGEQDRTPEIGGGNTARAVLAAKVFADFVKERTGKQAPSIVCGMDARPTGPAIADAALRTFAAEGVSVRFLGIAAAPEIMAYAKSADGFLYISASHNPIGHNGIKFGLNSGGVLNAEENAVLAGRFRALCEAEGADESARRIAGSADKEALARIYGASDGAKREALSAYRAFLRRSISGSADAAFQDGLFARIKLAAAKRHIGVVCDMNGSARTRSADADFFRENGIPFYAFNDEPGNIAHEIIPEAENLVHCAAEMERLQAEGRADAVIGYMPDCDGDRGNIVYWDSEKRAAVVLKAQEVFALSVLAELSYARWQNDGAPDFSPAVAVNCPTSMRIEEIAAALGARVFRAEVGEANVVSLAERLRTQGFSVPLCGEGSNGGTITWPSAVRDPMNTVFAIIKLLSIRELLEIWCAARGVPFRPDFTLPELLRTLPAYTTTGVSEPRAVLRIQTA